MKTVKKNLLLVSCAVLLVVSSVLGTMAYLTSQDQVTNTFTVGKVAITLDEAAVNPDGTYISNKDNRVDQNEYHLLPGHSYTKDPVVHVDAASENCWLFVRVENNIKNIEAWDAKAIEAQMTDLGWTLVDSETNVYAYKNIVEAGQNISVFESFKIAGCLDYDTLAHYDGKNIVVTAYAVQSDGFSTAKEAWTAAGFQA